jgi:aminoglycoside phosphotransferase family enzyme/predicted kinase
MPSQSEVITFLSSPAAFSGSGEVDIIETHGAYVFLCGDVALKLKRAVTYDYMDLATVELRHRMLVREIELNAPAAPMIYRDVVPVTREEDGLALAGVGPVVDWVLRMWRFPARDEFEAIADRRELDDDLANATGEAIAAYHCAAPVIRLSGAELIGDILDELARVFAEFKNAPETDGVANWLVAAGHTLEQDRHLLDARGRSGHVRRAHGDLHLRNLVRIDGRPVLFDALEFDETLGTCDVLYDVAFLIMDLCHRGLQQQACRVLDAWLRAQRGDEDSGLVALPLFLSVRAAIRAMVQLQTDAARGVPGASAAEIADYIKLANSALQKPPPVLISVGGYSASGKSVLARNLAPGIGPLPGAVMLASDLERKAGRARDEVLSVEHYSAKRRGDVYQAMFDRAETILHAGHAVMLDATFLDPQFRSKAEDVARNSGVGFYGFWLQASTEVLEHRIRARRKDPSDADISVLSHQLSAPLGNVDWNRIDASGDAESVLHTARKMLG